MKTRKSTRIVWLLEIQDPILPEGDRRKNVKQYVHHTPNNDMFDHLSSEEVEGAMEFKSYDEAWAYVRDLRGFGYIVKPVRVEVFTHYSFTV